MDRRAANGQRQEALWCVFLMFVVMALIIVRTGVVCRSLNAVVPVEDKPQDDEPALAHGPPSPSPDDLYRAVLVVLGLAEAAGRLLALEARTDWELINQPLPWPADEPPLTAASLCELQVLRLDTS
jgi:hypothetical protein